MVNIINHKEWKYFKIKDVFKVEKSKNIVNEIALENIGGKVPYITRTEYNNGIMFFVNNLNFKLENGNCITIGGEGANCFYQPNDFISGNNITKIYNSKLNEENGIFIVTLLNLEKYRYSYNRAFNKNNVENTMIKLPIDDNCNPDWKFMENYIKSLKEREREYWICWNKWTEILSIRY